MHKTTTVLLQYFREKVDAYFFPIQKDTTIFFLLVDKINKGNVSQIQSCTIANDFALSYSKKVWSLMKADFFFLWRSLLFYSGNRRTAVLEPLTKLVGGCDSYHRCESINQRTQCGSLLQLDLPQKWLTRLTRFLDNLLWPLKCSWDTGCNSYLPAACDLSVSVGDIISNNIHYISSADHAQASVCYENE